MLRNLISATRKIPFAKFGKSRPLILSERKFSSLIDDKKRAEENRYIRQEEEKQKAKLRESFEKLLAEESSNEKKAEILGLLAPAEEKKSWLSSLGLDYWMFVVPATMMVVIAGLQREVIVLNDDSYMLVGFTIFAAGLYKQLGGPAAKFINDNIENVRKTLNEVDDSIVQESKNAIVETKKLLTLEKDYKELYQLIDDLSIAQADVLNYSAEHQYRDAITKKLDSLVSIETSVTSAIRNKIIASVKSDVVTYFNDKKNKEVVLDQAIAVLMNGKNGTYPLGKDVVGQVFKSSLKTYRDNFASKSKDLNSILENMQKDISAITVPPIVEGEGGNVYVTHPIIKE